MFDSTTCKWLVNKTNPEYVDYLSKIASVSVPFAQVLINRGIKSPEQISDFFDPAIGNLSDPFDLPGLQPALDRIRNAKKGSERVLICGDYDADGVTATAIMVEGLTKYGLDVRYFIPNRMTHGYGFGAAGIEKAREIGAKLIITVDCGITSFEAVSMANSLGLAVIITDHHEPQRQSGVRSQESGVNYELPEALAIINPKLIAHSSQLSNLSGAGVAFKVMQALFGNIDDVHELFDLAALGTAADVVPVLGDNRIILKEGIKLIRSGERTGIRALKDAAGIKPDFFKTTFLHYMLIPRINAAGRITDANDVVRLLTTKADGEAQELARWLNEMNIKRQEIEQAVYKEAQELLESMDKEQGALVLASEGWHPGVVGIVASRIAETFCRPAIVLAIENGVAKGSGRSIPSFDMHYGLTCCKDMLKRFGGHKQAAGLSLLTADIDRFRDMISRVVLDTLSVDDFIPVLQIDSTVNLSDVTVELVDELAKLEPFGYGNDEPLFGARKLQVFQPRIVGNNHLKLNLRQNGRTMNSIGFAFGDMLNTVGDGSFVDAVFVPVINEWDGGRFLQLQLKALRPSTL